MIARFLAFLRRLGYAQAGATASEYAILASLVAAVALAAISTYGGNLASTYCHVAASFGPGGPCGGAPSGGDGGAGTGDPPPTFNPGSCGHSYGGTVSICDGPSCSATGGPGGGPEYCAPVTISGSGDQFTAFQNAACCTGNPADPAADPPQAMEQPLGDGMTTFTFLGGQQPPL